ncbi:MAG: hypothetical protein VKL42_00845 [Snowella sp.]|nr:hypothetical protein [Snowella sp.]
MVSLLAPPGTFPKIKSPSFDAINLQEDTNSNTDLMDSSLRPNPRFCQKFRILRTKPITDNNDFQKSVKNLSSLYEIDGEEIDEDDDIVKPSPYAFTEAYRLLNEVRNYFKTAFPYCASSLETKGGIDLVWDNCFLERRVWVEIPHNEQINGAIFYREKDKSKFISKIDFKRIMRLLIWINDSQMSIEDI